MDANLTQQSWLRKLAAKKWLKPVLGVLALLLVVAAAAPFFISIDDYIPRIEREMSARLKQPVAIKSIRFNLLPVPHVTIDGISVGGADDLKLGMVRVTPEVFSLLDATPVIKSIESDSLALTMKGIDAMLAWSKAEAAKTPKSAPPVRIGSIHLKHVIVDFGKGSFGPFDALVSLDGQGAPADAAITTQDGKLKARIKPEQATFVIDIQATAWTSPFGPPLVFDELILKGVATLTDAKLGEVSAKLYGGTASGKAALDWQKGLHLVGKFDIKEVEMQSIASMLSSGTHVSGRLSATPVLSAVAPDADRLVSALHVETPFNVRNGTLHGVDIRKAATSMIKSGPTGGETRFDHLSGHLAMAHGAFTFTQLKISSGALAANGNVNVSAGKALSGRINAKVDAVVTSATVPLNVAGTVDSPLLYPTGASIAGAAVGTALLGPGLGTGVGAKVGGWVDGLFGKK